MIIERNKRVLWKKQNLKELRFKNVKTKLLFLKKLLERRRRKLKDRPEINLS